MSDTTLHLPSFLEGASAFCENPHYKTYFSTAATLLRLKQDAILPDEFNAFVLGVRGKVAEMPKDDRLVKHFDEGLRLRADVIGPTTEAERP